MTLPTPEWLTPILKLNDEGITRALWSRWGLVYHPKSIEAFKLAALTIEDLGHPDSEPQAVILSAACNFLFHHFDLSSATWEDAPDDLLERITGSWHPKYDAPRIAVTSGDTGQGRYHYVATVLGLTRRDDWPELDRWVRRVGDLTWGEPLGADLANYEDEQLATLLYAIAWRRGDRS